MWDNIKEIISPLAPILGGLIGGPAGAAVGTILKQTLLGNKDASDEQLLQAVQSITPEQQLALKQADYNYQISMAQIDAQNMQTAAANTADARTYTKSISTNEKLPIFVQAFIALTPTFLTYINVLGFFIMALISLYYMHQGEISNVEIGLLSTLLGYGISEAKSTNNFHFGRDYALKEKDKTIENMSNYGK